MIAGASVCLTFKGLRDHYGSMCPSHEKLIKIITELTAVDEVRLFLFNLLFSF